MFNLTPAVRLLLIINVIVYVVPALLLHNHDLVVHLGGLHYLGSKLFMPWQYLSYMFIHADGMHLLTNMIGLVVFGPMLEELFGTQRFTWFFLLCGVGAGLLYSAWNYYEVSQLVNAADEYARFPGPEQFLRFLRKVGIEVGPQLNQWLEEYHRNPESRIMTDRSLELVNRLADEKINAPMVGASGSVFGVLMAFGLLFPNVMLFLLFPPIPVKAKYMVAFYAVVEIVSGLRRTPGDNVAHYAHLGGMLIALVFVLLWRKNNRYYS